MMSEALLRLVPYDQVSRLHRDAVDSQTLAQAAKIVEDVRVRGEAALREYAERFDGISSQQPLVLGPSELRSALESLPASDRELLERTAARIRVFAQAQRACLTDLEVALPGGAAGHTVLPMETAGCYAPGGRFPLPSSVLMTVVPARVAGVEKVWVASPKPTKMTVAAAAVAGADALLVAGGAHAIAALAYGSGSVPRCDAVVGPGNKWVTAAKQLVAGHVAIDMLAGPSELIVLADESADPITVAADLLAQAEHDSEAWPVLVTTYGPLVAAVNAELSRQLEDLPTAASARAALANGFATVARDMSEAVSLCNRLAPEHLELSVRDADVVAGQVRCYGGLFVGERSAEVLGDYGAGPNHVLPTGGTARSTGGLSVLTFLRVHTWLRIDDCRTAREMVEDAAALARAEHLEAHARSAERRL